MVYRVIGLMSGSSMDGLDIAYVHLQESAGKWSYEINGTVCYSYTPEWRARLTGAASLPAVEYQLLHTAYGHWLGEQVNHFINENSLHYQVQLIASHGHTAFHLPGKMMTAQLGDGAALAAATGINVVSDLRAMDVALKGQGAPIVPIGEKLLFPDYDLFLNLGGIANLSANTDGRFIAFDVCPANRVLDMLSAEAGQVFDSGGELAASGNINQDLLNDLNNLSYYGDAYPKSLANDFGTGIVLPMIQQAASGTADSLRTYTAHIVHQIVKALTGLHKKTGARLLVTGGGALNTFLINLFRQRLELLGISLVIPDEQVVQYKEALIMALIGVLRWREENNVMASITGATRNSIGGAVWIGQEA